MTKEELRRVTQHIIDLPAAPVIVAQLIDLVDDPSTSAVHLARLVSTDQALTARILKLANSSYYAFAQPIRTVQHAITLLGFQTVMSLALSLVFMRSFPSRSQEDEFDRQRFWEHALSVAVAARALSKEMNTGGGAEIFTVGILHDIGKLIVHEYMHDRYLLIESRIRLYGETSRLAESAVLGADHAEIGGWLCESWNLPEEIRQGVAFHHEPIHAAGVFTVTVHAADFLCNRLGHVWPPVSHEGEALDPAADERLPWRRVVAGSPDWPYYEKLISEEIDKAAEFISLIKMS